MAHSLCKLLTTILEYYSPSYPKASWPMFKSHVTKDLRTIEDQELDVESTIVKLTVDLIVLFAR